MDTFGNVSVALESAFHKFPCDCDELLLGGTNVAKPFPAVLSVWKYES
jgi:hypothetical protein